MVKKFSKIGICMVFVLSMILPQAAVSKAKTANPYTGKKYVYCSNYKDGIELYGKDGSKKKKYTLIKKEYSMRVDNFFIRPIKELPPFVDIKQFLFLFYF